MRLQQHRLHWTQGRAGVLARIARGARRDDIACGMAATFRQGRNVVLRQSTFAPSVAVGAAMVEGELQRDPLLSGEIIDDGATFQCFPTLTHGMDGGRMRTGPSLANRLGFGGVGFPPCAHHRICAFTILRAIIAAVMAVAFWIGVVPRLGLRAHLGMMRLIVRALFRTSGFGIARARAPLRLTLTGADLFQMRCPISLLRLFHFESVCRQWSL